ncbi:MAG: 6-carboxytetrahydropterin synthase [Planctomycetota bacterium]
MYTLEINHEFCAAHALTIAGVREPMHGHNFHVSVTLEAETLDSDGLVCDFHSAMNTLVAVCDPFENADLNITRPFDETNPTAENIAQHVAEAMAAKLDPHLSPNARIASARVTEAPGCSATYSR